MEHHLFLVGNRWKITIIRWKMMEHQHLSIGKLWKIIMSCEKTQLTKGYMAIEQFAMKITIEIVDLSRQHGDFSRVFGMLTRGYMGFPHMEFPR